MANREKGEARGGGDWFGRKGVAGGWYVGGLGFGLARLKRGCACTRHGGPC